MLVVIYVVNDWCIDGVERVLVVVLFGCCCYRMLLLLVVCGPGRGEGVGYLIGMTGCWGVRQLGFVLGAHQRRVHLSRYLGESLLLLHGVVKWLLVLILRHYPTIVLRRP